MKNEKTEMKTEPKAVKDMIVKVRYKGAGWSINYPEGMKMITDNEVETFDLTLKEQLYAFLQVMKQVNLPRMNQQHYLKKADKQNPHRIRHRFEIVDGLENVPEVLKNVHFQRNDFFSKEERKAIEGLVPDFFPKKGASPVSGG